jgi:hypothetical protein
LGTDLAAYQTIKSASAERAPEKKNISVQGGESLAPRPKPEIPEVNLTYTQVTKGISWILKN